MKTITRMDGTFTSYWEAFKEYGVLGAFWRMPKMEFESLIKYAMVYHGFISMHFVQAKLWNAKNSCMGRYVFL